MENNADLKEKMDEEVINRIRIMESPSYEHGPRLKRTDYIGASAVGIICILGLIWGVN